MGKKPLVTKSHIMKLASEQAMSDRERSIVTELWVENEPTLDANSDNLFEELCTAAKEGDLEKTKSLVTNFGAPINMIDRWQCNPLFYACLCGHYEVVQFLLENGAQCDPNTFTGERCLYGALNDRIRKLLRSYKFSKAINENQPYLQFLTDLYTKHHYSDLTFVIRRPLAADEDGGQDEEFRVQRYVMAARSKYFREQLSKRWRDQPIVRLSSKHVDAAAFSSVLKYLYTGQLVNIKKPVLENMVFVCKHLDMRELQARCEELLKEEVKTSKNALKAQDANEMARIRGDYEAFLRELLGIAMYIAKTDIPRTYVAIQSVFDDEVPPIDPSSTFADVGIFIDDVVFPCHKAVLCRSEYFDIMLQGEFSEANVQSSCVRYNQGSLDYELHLPVIELHSVSAESFVYVLEFLYTDRCTIPTDQAFDVMLVADMLMLDRLKSIASIALTSADEPIMDIFQLTRTAVELNVDRLEQWCIRYFSDHLDRYIQDPLFHELIRESAQSIAGRQETDSIPFIDELRYWLGKKYCVFQEELNPEGRIDEEYRDDWTDLEALYNEKLEMLDQVLASLGLDA
ncbi:BTB/POZ protein [Dichotomocladium elegans]|nr:BTB/POZ protein [Dichotomocladium elegans]